MRLSKNFTLQELTHSDTALAHDIDNSPGTVVITNLNRLTQEILQPIRNVRPYPITITSGYRSPELNSHPDIAGAKGSYHTYGLAADVVSPIRYVILQFSFNGKIIHVTVNGTFALFLDIILGDLPYDKVIHEYGYGPGEPRWIHVQIAKEGANPRKEIYIREVGKPYRLVSRGEVMSWVWK
jgi:hypothetical protein